MGRCCTVRGVWVSPDQIEKVHDDAKQYLIGKFKLAYLHGKGTMFVPILVPLGLIDAINLLIQHRNAFGTPKGSVFLFANKGSGDNCSDKNCLNELCQVPRFRLLKPLQ